MKSLRDFEPYHTMYVDAMNLLSRSHYGMPMLEYKGIPTGMLMGAVRLVLDHRKHNPSLRIVFVWEGSGSWRKEAHPIYKAERRKNNAAQPEESKRAFRKAVELVEESLPSMGVYQVSADRYEADDTVWTAMAGNPARKLFVSTDWDWWSLVKHGDILYVNTILEESGLNTKFVKKFNCEPIPMDRIWVFKVLTGDPSDGVSGIPRFPRKLAALLAADTSLVELEEIIQGMVSLGYPQWATKTRDNSWILKRNLELIKIVPPDPSLVKWIPPDPYVSEAFGDLLLKSGMSYMYDRFMGGNYAAIK